MDKLSNESNRPARTHRLLQVFAVITCVGAYIMILLGVLVTTTGSGHGCGNTWPFCDGQIIPGVITVAGLIEYGHRVMSTVDGMLVLILTVAAWFMFRSDFRVKFFAAMSLLFVVLQGALGALTVVFEGTFALNWLLAFHFGLALIAFASVVLLTIRLFQVDREQPGSIDRRKTEVPALQVPLVVLAIYTYLVVYTGALVEHTGAVVGCGTQYPLCGSTFLPGLSSLAGIQVFHRYMAGLLWLFVLLLLVVIVRRHRDKPRLVSGAGWAFLLITLQAASGSLNVFSQGQLLAAVIHATLIAVFFSVLCYLSVEVGWPWRRKQQVAFEESKQLDLSRT